MGQLGLKQHERVCEEYMMVLALVDQNEQSTTGYNLKKQKTGSQLRNVEGGAGGSGWHYVPLI
jgi:hypothetical protein